MYTGWILTCYDFGIVAIRLFEHRLPVEVLRPVRVEIKKKRPLILLLLAVFMDSGVVKGSDNITGDVVGEPLIRSCEDEKKKYSTSKC